MTDNEVQISSKLPIELLLIIKEHIPLADLRTHVCFYNTCRTTASFYGDSSQQAAFWRRTCALSGIGWLKSDSSWKEIAFETITKDGFCVHPHCGGELLDWNADQIARAMKWYNWDPEEGPWDAAFDEVHAEEWLRPDRPNLLCSPIFQWIYFSSHPLPSWYFAGTDARIRTENPAMLLSPNWVSSHPVAARSFATFPTVRRMRFHYNNLSYGSKAEGAMGVMVWDVLRSIQSDLDQELSIPELLDLLTGPFKHIFSGRTSKDFARDLRRFSSLKGLCSTSHWMGLHFIRSDGDGPVFETRFVLKREEIEEDERPVSDMPWRASHLWIN